MKKLRIRKEQLLAPSYTPQAASWLQTEANSLPPIVPLLSRDMATYSRSEELLEMSVMQDAKIVPDLTQHCLAA